jgi:hypothetical protein
MTRLMLGAFTILAARGADLFATTTYEYDAQHRLTRVIYSGCGTAVRYEYDGSGNRTKRVVAPPHRLPLNIVHPTWGTITVDPNQPTYIDGTQVTLSATPISGKSFQGWYVDDPNYPGDGNYTVFDRNGTLAITMDADRTVQAVFQCGSGLDQSVPLLAATLMVCTFASCLGRRRR